MLQMLGLNADVYVPDPEALWQAKGWHKAISAEACSRLAVLWEQSVREPMLATVDRHPSYPPSADIFRPPVAGATPIVDPFVYCVLCPSSYKTKQP